MKSTRVVPRKHAPLAITPLSCSIASASAAAAAACCATASAALNSATSSARRARRSAPPPAALRASVTPMLRSGVEL